MPRRANESSGDIRDVLVEAFAVNESINQLILQHLDPRAWRATPPGSKARTIAAIFSHVHNIRRKWVRLSAPHLKLPPELDRTKLTQRQASSALAQSAKRCSEMLAEALGNPHGRVKKFLRDGWARPWPAGAAMVAYMLTHEAHHRGQICMLAHQLGYPLPMSAISEMWSWERLWKKTGFPGPR